MPRRPADVDAIERSFLRLPVVSLSAEAGFELIAKALGVSNPVKLRL